MKFGVASGAMSAATNEIEGEIAAAATGAMKDASRATVMDLREQIRNAGLGNRLANTWRDRVYPLSRRSMTPAGYIWTNAPDIVDAFSRGAQVVPVNGSKFLAIPTDNVPRARGRRGSTRRMTPVEVQGAFNQELFFKRGKNGRVLAFVNVVAASNARGFRKATAGRLAQGRKLTPILMFVLVPSVRLPKLLDLNGPAQRGAAQFETGFRERLSRS